MSNGLCLCHLAHRLWHLRQFVLAE
ncbi:hypothetical protein J5A70_09360 [Prevotella nigrescens]|nr:hypothetical protein J5A70_09360 [Prevotella nigrescens]QUB55370.1 hypothetical protein J4865_10745 [Prevotella nigrescens F0103]